MRDKTPIWLVRNETSGSNDQAAIETLEACCGDAGFHIARTISFPKDELPTPRELDLAGIGTVAVFAGDGTINALLGGLAGWGGEVLVLPGGTMNLLYHRLHGDKEMDEVVRLAAAGRAKPVRIGIVASDLGEAYAGLLAGPGTSWYDVREAMRDVDPLAVAENTVQAIGETLAAPAVICAGLGRREGYPLVMITPRDDGLAVAGFHSETVGEYLSQGFALLKRDFRVGPHDELGTVRSLALASSEDAPFGILLDGEKVEAAGKATFRLEQCGVQLLATLGDGD